jgi:hypothetical protein
VNFLYFASSCLAKPLDIAARRAHCTGANRQSFFQLESTVVGGDSYAHFGSFLLH